jgi:hypothetical protein
MTEIMDAFVNDGMNWQKVGDYPGPVMYVLGFMRIERVPYGHVKWRFRAWDVLRVPAARPTYPTKIFKTLTEAKGYCEGIMKKHRGEGVTA